MIELVLFIFSVILLNLVLLSQPKPPLILNVDSVDLRRTNDVVEASPVDYSRG